MTVRRVAYAAVALLAALLGGLVLSTSCERDPKPSSGLSEAERELVDRYLEALERRDVDAVLALGNPVGDRRAAAQKEVDDFGGHRLSNVQLRHSRPVSPGLTRVTIRAEATGGQPFEHTIDLVRSRDTWYLRLTNAEQSSGGGPSPASTDG